MAAGLQKVPMVVSAALVCAVPLSCGAAALAAGAAFYAFVVRFIPNIITIVVAVLSIGLAIITHNAVVRCMRRQTHYRMKSLQFACA